MTRFLIRGMIVLLALAGCKGQQHVLSSQKELSFCKIAQADVIVVGSVLSWGNAVETQAKDQPPAVRTPVKIAVTQALRGSVSGQLDVFVQDYVDITGKTNVGVVKGPDGLSSGVFFLSNENGQYVVRLQGFYQDEHGILRNVGVHRSGIDMATLQADLAQITGAICPRRGVGERAPGRGSRAAWAWR